MSEAQLGGKLCREGELAGGTQDDHLTVPANADKKGYFLIVERREAHGHPAIDLLDEFFGQTGLAEKGINTGCLSPLSRVRVSKAG